MYNERRKTALLSALLSVFLFITPQCHCLNLSASSSLLNANITEALFRVPLHAVSGTHHVQVWIGQPPQQQTFIVDTGSRLTATSCLPCRDCGNPKNRANPHFNPKQSSTLRRHTCQHERQCHWTNTSTCVKQSGCEIVQKYTEGSSWTALEVNDFMFLGDNNTDTLEEYMDFTIPFTFGCQNSVNGLFRKQYANGILGLERSRFSLISHMHKHGVLPYDAFSLCHTPTAGQFGLGGPLFNLHVEPMVYTPLVAIDGGWYSVHVEALYLGDECLSCKQPGMRHDPIETFAEGRGTIIDSGTTDTYLPVEFEEDFERVWEEMTSVPFTEQTHSYTYDEFTKLPMIRILLLHNVTITIEPQHYMEDAPMVPWTGKRSLTNRIYIDEANGAVIGLNAMMDYDILFDATHERLGIARANCDPASQSLT